MSARTHARLLESAAFQSIRYDERADATFQRERVREACADLGCDPERDVRHFVRNRNADLWKIDAGDTIWLLKILTSKPVETLECEYAHLTELHRLAETTRAFRVPRPRVLFPGRSAYVMEFVESTPLATILLGPSLEPIHAALDTCGRVLRTVHEAWGADTHLFDGAQVAADFQHLPWKPRVREAEVLDAAIDRLDGSTFAASRLYLDFDPVNIGLTADGSLLLLDPPERQAVDATGWDLGVFQFGLRRGAWRHPRAMREYTRRVDGMRVAFDAGYAGSSNAGRGAGDAERLLVAIAELARLGQLWRWWMRPWSFRQRAVGVARALYARPLLAAARRHMFVELASIVGGQREG